MRALLGAVAAALTLAGAAEGATRTFQAVFTDMRDAGGALAALGADPAATEMVFTWAIDDSAPPLGGPYTHSNPAFEFDNVYLPYLWFDLSVGGVTLPGTVPLLNTDRVEIMDGVADHASDVWDSYYVESLTDRAGPLGSTIFETYFFLRSTDETIFGRAPGEPDFSGLAQPSAQALNALAADTAYGRLSMWKPDGSSAYLIGETATVREIGVVPLPAAGWALVAGLAGLVALGRRRSG